MSATQEKSKQTRPPIVVVLGHVDHGKSSLLDYIRKTNVTEGEAGGITQHVGAYEIETEGKKITFIDTPGHSAFQEMRKRGAALADIAILVVAADDGVKPQTLEALKAITESQTPYVVAINKVDKPGANVERTKQSLAEAGVFVEGYGGTIPVVETSAKSGSGIADLLTIVLLAMELEELTGDSSAQASGLVVESHRDERSGTGATLVITDGTLTKGSFVVAGRSIAPVRSLLDFRGKPLQSASFSSPVMVSGWSELPSVGETFATYASKKEAQEAVEATPDVHSSTSGVKRERREIMIPLALKADTAGTLEAIEAELVKRETEKVGISFVALGVGTVTEGDIKPLVGSTGPVVIAFNVSLDTRAKDTIDKNTIHLKQFSIIYKLTEWFEEYLIAITPIEEIEVTSGSARVLKTFSSARGRHIIGGQVTDGLVVLGNKVRITRRDTVIGEGKIVGLQKNRVDATEIQTGEQFGASVESKFALAEGDTLEIVSKQKI